MSAPDAALFIISDSGLPAEEDHSYTNYLSAFRRIIEKHTSHVQKYRENYPGYKLIFFVFDEATAYFETKEPLNHRIHEGECIQCKRPHFFFADEAFLDIIRHSEADFFIWYAPFKHEHLFVKDKKLVLPNVVVFDVSNIDIDATHYDPDCMVSAEV